MKKLLIGLLVFIFIMQLVNAAEVCVVLDYGDDNPDSKCLDVEEGVNAYELLNDVGWSLEWIDYGSMGHFLNSLEGVTNDPQGNNWMFSLAMDGDWFLPWCTLDGEGGCWNRNKESSVGHYCTKDGDVIGLAYGGWTAHPEMFTVNITKIYVDGEKQRESKTRSGKIVDVFPESVVKFKIEFENLYDHSTDIEIKDISTEGTIEEIDDGDDIDEELNEFDLGADKKKTEELEFTIPLEVEAKDRLVRIKIKAEDDAGIKYEKEFTYDLEVEKEKHKLKILKAELDKDSYECGANALLSFYVINIGDEEEDVNLRIVNEELELDINENFELSNDAFKTSSKYEERFNIWLPDYISKGTYALMVTADYTGEKETANVDLVISECETAETAGEAEEVEGREEVTDLEVGEISEEEEMEAEISEGGMTRVKDAITANLPLILTVVLGVLFVLIIALLVIFWLIRK